MNAAHAEGVIRRLFCGSISEIRVTDGEIGVQDSLLFATDTIETTTTTTRVTTTKATTTKSKTHTVTRGESSATTVQNTGMTTPTVPLDGETDTQPTDADMDDELEADTETGTTAKRKTQIMVQHRPINALWIWLVVGAELVAAAVAAVIGMWILRKKRK